MAAIPVENPFLGLGLFIMVGAIYFSAMECSSYQGTLGKWFVGIRVEDDQGMRLEPLHAMARFFAGTASWATLNIGHLMATWRPDGRALHDLIAKTRVCQERKITAQHDVAVALFLAIHVVALLVSIYMAVQRAVDALNASGALNGVAY